MKSRLVPLILGWVILIIAEGVGVYIVFKLKDYKFLNHPTIKAQWWTPHTLLNAINLVILTGHGMVIFRLLPGVKTRYIKFIHFFIHTYVLLWTVWSYFFMQDFMDHFDLVPRHVSTIHSMLGKIILGIYGAQYVLSLMIFLYMYSDQTRRKTFSACHNFVGIFLLQLLILNACLVMESNYHGARTRDMPLNNDTSVLIALLISYGLLINCIVLNPYMEWPLIGPI